MASSATTTELNAGGRGTAGNARRSLFWMVVIALLLRLLVMSFLYPERTDPYRDHWRMGGESGRIARSIAQGEGFSNTITGKTGPTAWLAPVFPYLLAGIFKIFGIYSKASAIAALALDCLFSALTCIPIYFIAKKHFGAATAAWAGWAWAFFPYGIYFSADFIWATTLTTLLMTIVFLSAIYLETSSSVWPWVGFGALSGLGGLTDPVVMSVAPFLGAWAWYRLYNSGRAMAGSGIGSGAGCALVCISVVHSKLCDLSQVHSVPQLSGPGSLFWQQSGFVALGASAGYHPSDSENEWREYQQLGESLTPRRSFTRGWRSSIRTGFFM